MKKTHIKIILLLVSVCALVFIWRRYEYIYRDPLEVLKDFEESYQALEYLSSYESRFGSIETNDHLLRLITQNENYRALCYTGMYIEKTGKCEFLPHLETMCRYYEAMPKDTLLLYTRQRRNILGGYYYYKNIYSHFTFSGNICTIATRLREKCEAQYGSPDLFPEAFRDEGIKAYEAHRSALDSMKHDTLHKP